jgi:hypothetical protein
MTITKILLGHNSEETAYLVEDYPYGRVVRCRIRYWIEFKAGKGFRFMAQTENPKTLRWNKPKASIYQPLGGVMYLDEKGYVQWEGLSQYASAKETLQFVNSFSGANLSVIRAMVPAALQYHGELAKSELSPFSFNGVRRPQSDEDRKRHAADLATWQEIEKTLAV